MYYYPSKTKWRNIWSLVVWVRSAKPAVLLLNLLASQKLIWVEIQEKSIGYTFSDADSVVTAIKKKWGSSQQWLKYYWNFFLRWKKYISKLYRVTWYFQEDIRARLPSSFSLQTLGCGFELYELRRLLELQLSQLISRQQDRRHNKSFLESLWSTTQYFHFYSTERDHK